jgi:hypothetical protein
VVHAVYGRRAVALELREHPRAPPQQREAWRAGQVEGRSTILALMATLADEDWDDAISW